MLVDDQVELPFYNDDGSYKTVVVEENLRAVDLCQLLALKNHVGKDINWALVERLDDLDLERSIEDHEEVLHIYLSWGPSIKSRGNKFYFRKDFRKYEFFHHPEQFFPPEMVDVGQNGECLSDSSELSRIIVLQTLISNVDKTPDVSDSVWVREVGKHVWRKAFFILHGKILYQTYKSGVKDISQMQRFADLSHFNVYIAFNGRKVYKSPSEFCFCLKPTSDSTGKELLYFCCETDKARFCWITAIRIAKYGRFLRENYNSFKSRHMDALSPGTPEYNSQQVPLESVRTRVAMDFTGNYGKIVEDPLEAQAIAIAEGRYWNKKRRPCGKKISGGILRGLDAGVHITQSWFHSGLTREEASQLLIKHGTVDGVFLVRDSRSMKNDYVLSFVQSGKVLHLRITMVEEKDHVCYTLDNGKTKFYDLLQLVEFYQLNTGCLPTKLTHYIVPNRCIVSNSPTLEEVSKTM